MQNSLAYCVKEKKLCVWWVDKYFKDCLCNLNDEFSFGFGLISLVCWGVAEIPQIITNFRTKTSHGVSLLFLLTWIIGLVFFSPFLISTLFFDSFSVLYFIKKWCHEFIVCLLSLFDCSDIFNLVGCLLEPATVIVQSIFKEALACFRELSFNTAKLQNPNWCSTTLSVVQCFSVFFFFLVNCAFQFWYQRCLFSHSKLLSLSWIMTCLFCCCSCRLSTTRLW